MRIDVFTIFPEMIDGFTSASLLGKARAAGTLDVRSHDLRDWATDVHRSVDDAPFGGGAGMVLKPDVVVAAVEGAEAPRPVLYMGPAGKRFDQSMARDLATGDGFSLLCGRYEGVDQRALDGWCDGAISIGDYVLAGGEAAALVVIEAVARLVPGVMGNDSSATEESFSADLLEYPHYTRPAEFRDMAAPEVLRSGDHGRIRRWRHAQSLVRTARSRPDLIRRRGVSDDDRSVLAEFGLLQAFEGATDDDF